MNRRSNFELLRIIAIFFVIIIHSVSPMLYIGYPDKFTWKYSALLISFSYTAVPIFVLLTGYFYNTKTKYTIRLKKLGLQYFYQYNGYTDQFAYYYFFFVLICTLSLFMFFRQLNIKYPKAINCLALLTYGGFLNHIFIREIANLRFPSLDGVFGIKYIILTAELIALTFIFFSAA